MSATSHQDIVNMCCAVTSVNGQMGFFCIKVLNDSFHLYLDETCLDDKSRRLFNSVLALSNDAAKNIQLLVTAKCFVDHYQNDYYSASSLDLVHSPACTATGSVELDSSQVGCAFYLGNNWVVTSAHNFDEEGLKESTIVFQSTEDVRLPFKISSAFAYLPPPGDALADSYAEFMLLKLSGDMSQIPCAKTVPWAPGNLSDIVLLSHFAGETVQICVNEVKTNSFASVLEVKFLDSSTTKTAFAHGRSGSPLVGLGGVVCGIVIQCRDDSGFALVWDTNFLAKVSPVLALSSMITRRQTEQLASLNIQYYSASNEATYFASLDYSPYRTKFNSISTIIQWWESADAELAVDLVGRGAVQGTKETWLLPYKKTNEANGRSESFLIVHIHPCDSMNRTTMNFASEVEGCSPAKRASNDIAGYEAMFEAWKVCEDPVKKNKPAITRDTAALSAWSLKSGCGKVMLNSKIIMRIEADYGNEVSKFKTATAPAASPETKTI